RVDILIDCHDKVGHRGVFATRPLIGQRFWWPSYEADVLWYVRTCLICQQRQRLQISLPPTVAMPASLFAKIYVDTMHMPPSHGYRYIIQGRCSITSYPEFRLLKEEDAAALAKF
ncbi:hypothetical protein FA95DRAFT_1465879, partial [Auriscalpium vulgare]